MWENIIVTDIQSIFSLCRIQLTLLDMVSVPGSYFTSAISHHRRMFITISELYPFERKIEDGQKKKKNQLIL